MSEQYQKMVYALREVRDALGESGLEALFNSLGVAGLYEIDIEKRPAAIALAGRMVAHAPKSRGRATGTTQDRLNAMAKEHYAKLRGESADAE